MLESLIVNTYLTESRTDSTWSLFSRERSAIVAKLCIECCVKIWRYCCEMIQINKESNVDDVLRSKLLTYSLSLQDTPWLLQSQDRHLIERNMKFFQNSRRVTLLSWKNCLDVALKLAEQSVSEVGGDLTYYFGQTQIRQFPRRSRVVLICYCKQAKLGGKLTHNVIHPMSRQFVNDIEEILV